ncbi:plasmid mobilization protein [Saccharicrinis aurantiacus]|uniref:plasmid mobilization protein n=1 Tax=Saccharicrinis aurantiacus TaxID=1849719 RepID=UPI0009502A11|nr:plasmid mobilization relaxosome protein MobC [Saccharicrinis aurantiacus]
MNNLRSIKITVRLNQQEYDVVKNKSDKCRISISTFIRNSALDKQIKETMSSEEITLYRKLAGMSNNINQLAKNSHTQGMASISVILLKSLQELDSVIKQIKV